MHFPWFSWVYSQINSFHILHSRLFPFSEPQSAGDNTCVLQYIYIYISSANWPQAITLEWVIICRDAFLLGSLAEDKRECNKTFFFIPNFKKEKRKEKDKTMCKWSARLRVFAESVTREISTRFGESVSQRADKPPVLSESWKHTRAAN